MKLSKKAIGAINTPVCRMKIAMALGKTENTVRRYINENDDDLTKAAALEVIERETGLTREEILETESQNA